MLAAPPLPSGPGAAWAAEPAQQEQLAQDLFGPSCLGVNYDLASKRSMLVEEALSPSNLLVFAKPPSQARHSPLLPLVPPRPRQQPRVFKVGNQWIMCRATLGAPDGCLLCRLRQGINCEPVAPPKGARATLPPFRFGTARPRLLERSPSPDVPGVLLRGSPTAAAATGAAPSAPHHSRPASLASTLERPLLRQSGDAAQAVPVALDNGEGEMMPSPFGLPAAEHTDVARDIADIEKVRPKSALWKLSHRKSRGERLAFVQMCSKMKNQQKLASGVFCDQVTRPETMELAQESFWRYFPQKAGGPYHREALIGALADFGLKAHTRPERSAVHDVLTRWSSFGSIDIHRFLAIVEECRGALRVAFAERVYKAWKYVDLLDVGSIDRAQCHQLLAALNLAPPRFEEERLYVEALLDDLNWDKNEQVNIPEVEFLVLHLREFRDSSRRKAEWELRERYQMAAATLNEFRGQLVEMHEAFLQAGPDDNDSLDQKQIVHILTDFGCLRSSAEMNRGQGIIQEFMGGESGETAGAEHELDIDFVTFLDIVRRLRAMERERMKGGVVTAFRKYDAEGMGELDIKQLCPFLVELDLLPRNHKQQESLVKLFDEVDADGFGKFCLEEVQVLVQQVSETLVMVQRAVEMDEGLALGFSKKEVHMLRSAFAELDIDNSEALGVEEVGKAVRMMEWTCTKKTLKRLSEQAEVDASGRLSFTGFLNLMRHIQGHSDSGVKPSAEIGAASRTRASKAMLQDVVTGVAGTGSTRRVSRRTQHGEALPNNADGDRPHGSRRPFEAFR